MKNVFLIDPYYSDSHRYWGECIKENLNANVEVISRSPVHWKWRMEGAAIDIAKEVAAQEIVPDVFLVTDFLHLALFKSLLPIRFQRCRFVLYMHENQLTYPQSNLDTDQLNQRDNHYGFINYTSCLVADAIAFNSQYHFDEYFKAVEDLSKRLPDTLDIDGIKSKSKVIPLSLKTVAFLPLKKSTSSIKTIVWNHRWEYDKRPDLFLKAMIELKAKGIQFRLTLLGKMDQTSKNKYAKELDSLDDRIDHVGYCDSIETYYDLLSHADLIISSSIHDFFGISVLEGIYAGCRPILPYDLAYPELIPPSLYASVFYDRGELVPHIIQAIEEEWTEINQRELRAFVEDHFTWPKIEKAYGEMLTLS